MRTSWIVLGCLLVGLAGCGGGGDDSTPPPPTTSVPASAGASIQGYIGYLQALVASAADMLEPVDVSAVTPPTDETSEPLPIQ